VKDKVNVLVVDDDASWSEIYREALADKGYAAHVAPDLKTALDHLDQQFFHVAIVDIRLDADTPDNVDGLQVLQRIWELDEGTWAIVVSGYATPDMFPSFRQYGVFDFVQKSASPGDLAQQYKSAAFIQGAIEKGASLSDSLRQVDRAVLKARHTLNKKKWTASPFRLFKGWSGKKAQTDLGGAGMIELRQFVGHLCRPLYPWLYSQDKALAIRDEQGKTLAIEAFVWSRGLGQPVIVRFGRRESWAQALALQALGISHPGAEPGDEILRHQSGHFEGLVRAVPNLSFGASFDSPPPKRVSRSSLP
jgi:ActR/RegA family two-component response regulator